MKLPEKYYEACITYNLINDFRIRFDQPLYPISFSQMHEHHHGLDFGYLSVDQGFFLQYKRPFTQNNNIISWEINIEQLETICSMPFSFACFYALPAFFDVRQWYEGLRHCFFVSARALRNHIGVRIKQRSYFLHSDSITLQQWESIAESFFVAYNNTVVPIEDTVVTMAQVASFIDQISDTWESAWFYMIKEDYSIW